MALITRCQDCTRSLEMKLGPSSAVGASSRRRSKKPPSKYRSESYEPLPNKRGHLRVLRLKGSSPENPHVDCELRVIKFVKDEDLEISYEALSWNWGTEKASVYINIQKNGKVYAKYVQPDMLAALKALRHDREDRILWIDAICINQDDPQEKNHQVEMMSEIYSRADQVCIWLGEGDKSSELALKFIRREVLQLQNFDELCESKLATKKWSALLDLMQRPWFSRRWVVQEVALARRAMVYCGKYKISWRKFAVAVELFVEVETATHRLSEVMKKDPNFYHVPGWFEYVSALGASLLVEATGKLFRDYKPGKLSEAEIPLDNQSDAGSLSEGSSDGRFESDSDTDVDSEPDVPAESFDLATREHRQPLLSLEYLVSSLSIFGVTRPHDAVYALLAIAKDTIPSASDDDISLILNNTQGALEDFTQKKKYNVDYTQPFTDVCREFVQFCIAHSDRTRALDIICRPWAPEPSKHTSRREKLPADAMTTPTINKSPGNKIPVGGIKSKNGDRNKTSNSQEQSVPKSQSKEQSEDQIPLPSWIPQLSGAAHAMLPQAGVHTLKMGRKNADTLVGLPSSAQSLQRNYNAAETKEIDSSLRFRKSTAMKCYSMYVKGFELDSITELQPSSQGGAIPSAWARAGGWHKVPNSDPPDDFWRTLVADRGRDGRNPPVYYARACKESFMKGGISSGSVNTTDLINNERCSVVAQFCRRVQAVIWNRRLIKTETGRLGLASEHVQLEDKICILYGCSVPVVLRRKWKTLDEVNQEISEDIRLWLENIRVKWEIDCRNRKSSRLKRVLGKLKWANWDQQMQKLWQQDEDWQAKWTQKVEERKKEQEKKDKKALTQNIKEKQEEMGYFLKCNGESDIEYQERLSRKSYRFWKEEKQAQEIDKGGVWSEPMPRWREFEIFLKYGRRWGRKREVKKVQQQPNSSKKKRSGAIKLFQDQKTSNLTPLESVESVLPKPINGFKGETTQNPVEDIRRLSTPVLATEGSQEKDSQEKDSEEKDEYMLSNGFHRTSTMRTARTDQSDVTNRTTDTSSRVAEHCQSILKEKFALRFKASQSEVLKEPDQSINPREKADFKQNWCYYELLGECYVHGMMDGEAMKYQNDKSINAQIFELR